MNNSVTDARVYRMRWWMVVVIAVSILIVIIDTTIVNIALPTSGPGSYPASLHPSWSNFSGGTIIGAGQLYPNEPGKESDSDYFIEKHMAMVSKKSKPYGFIRYEVGKAAD